MQIDVSWPTWAQCITNDHGRRNNAALTWCSAVRSAAASIANLSGLVAVTRTRLRPRLSTPQLNTNGLLRQYLPKGTNLSRHSAAELVDIQRSLNGRPRKTLGYLTPSEAYARVVAATA